MAAPAGEEQLLELVRTRDTSLEQVTKEPKLMLDRIALLCRLPTEEELAKQKQNPHRDKYARLFVDKAGRAAAEGRETFHPEGTLLLKEKQGSKEDGSPNGEVELFTAMLKREKGYNPDCGDWEFLTFSGDGKKVTTRGKLASCMDCHREYATQDFTSRQLVPARRIKPDAGGSLVLPASEAYVFGQKLRYEPQPQKNTLGYWTVKEDTAQWQVDLPAGRYEVEVLQGCGKGSGGAEVALVFSGLNETAGQDVRINFTVEDTGHFQNFKPRTVGTLEVKSASPYSRLEVAPQTKPGAAVMDLRQVTLRPVKP
jgi:Cytochrome P460